MAKLQLEVIDGRQLIPDKLVINAHGLENYQGLRGIKDGVVHFGSQRFTIKERLNEMERQIFEQMQIEKRRSSAGKKEGSLKKEPTLPDDENVPYNDYVFEAEPGE